MKRVVPNPLISINLTPKEVKYIKKYADKFGVSEAQIARGLLRRGIATLTVAAASPHVKDFYTFELEVVKMGSL